MDYSTVLQVIRSKAVLSTDWAKSGHCRDEVRGSIKALENVDRIRADADAPTPAPLSESCRGRHFFLKGRPGTGPSR